MLRMNITITIVFITCFLSSLVYGEAVPPQVMKAAQVGIINFINSIPRAELAKCGIPEDYTLKDIELGFPLKIVVLDDSVLKSDAVKSFNILVQDANMWYVPVVLNGDYVSILTITFQNDEWKAVGLGKAAFSREIQRTFIQFSHYSSFNRYILKDYQLKSDFLIYQKDKDIFWYPFKSAQRALNLSKSDYQQILPEVEELITKISVKLKMEGK